MSTTTHDRAKLGRTTYAWSVYRWDEDRGDNVYLDAGETDTLVTAKIAAEASLTKHDGDQADIRRGTYEANEFTDPEYGRVLDAEWTEDDRWACYGFTQDGAVRWEGETW